MTNAPKIRIPDTAVKSDYDTKSTCKSNEEIQTTCLKVWDDVDRIARDWSALVSRATNSSVFQTYEWNSCWWKAFGDNHELCVIACHKKKQLVGIAPMMIVRGIGKTGRPDSQICFVGSVNGSSDYLDFIVDPNVPDALDALLSHTFHFLSNVQCIDLSHFPTHFENLARTVRYFRARTFKIVSELDQVAPCRIMGQVEDDRKAANKSSLRRHFNYFRKSGALRFHRCRSASESLEYIDIFFDQHIARRNMTDKPSQFLDPAERSFYRCLVTELFPKGWLRFDVVLFDDQPIAFHFGFEYRNKFVWYKPSFDVNYSKRSPGEVLMKFLLEDATQKRLDEFDFTVGAEPFKFRFSNKIRYNKRIVVFRSFSHFCIYRIKATWRNAGIRRQTIEAKLSVPPGNAA